MKKIIFRAKQLLKAFIDLMKKTDDSVTPSGAKVSGTFTGGIGNIRDLKA